VASILIELEKLQLTKSLEISTSSKN
jgi:hypothetical protein